jgi:hypothetical protein
LGDSKSGGLVQGEVGKSGGLALEGAAEPRCR